MKVFDFPDCPTCAKRVTSLVVEEADARVEPTYAAYSVTVLEDPNRYTLNPCGHEVRGYVQKAPGYITEWRL